MLHDALATTIQQHIDNKTKPLGSLGQLETLATQICKLQGRTDPVLSKPAILVFAADHGLADSGVSAYPQSVTAQMVMNFVNGGAAINVFARQNKLQLKIVDAGVASDFPQDVPIVHCKVAKGTANMLHQAAMSEQQRTQCESHARALVQSEYDAGCNVIGFGEMGIGNTSAATLIMHYLLDCPLQDCAGRGTGLDDAGLRHKLKVLQQVRKKHGDLREASDVLQSVGGFEIAMICYGMIQAAQLGMLVLIDGFIATAAAMLAVRLEPESREAMAFCHQSGEPGHQRMLHSLDASALLQLDMRLGEGTGCALAYPLVQAAVNFINEMASFESAGIDGKSDDQ